MSFQVGSFYPLMEKITLDAQDRLVTIKKVWKIAIFISISNSLHGENIVLVKEILIYSKQVSVVGILHIVCLLAPFSIDSAAVSLTLTKR